MRCKLLKINQPVLNRHYCYLEICRTVIYYFLYGTLHKSKRNVHAYFVLTTFNILFINYNVNDKFS